MIPQTISLVRLRDIVPDDLPTLYEFNLDPEGNRLAATNPRNTAAFASHWEKVLADSDVVAKAINVEERLVGFINCFRRGDSHFVGYWLGREFWGQGIASRALELLLSEVAIRPLHAQVATGNQASLRVLQKCGFVIRSVQFGPADERNLECEEALLVLE
ncbi:MAG: GNAT family N-acetyltransferase [Planctomycetaceae bacterium]|nr:GNAT family N-acetyltransferase [Planctomycetaceae bacterium]